MKKFLYILLVLPLWFLASCSDDDEPEYIPQGQEEVLITDVSGATVIPARLKSGTWRMMSCLR